MSPRTYRYFVLSMILATLPSEAEAFARLDKNWSHLKSPRTVQFVICDKGISDDSKSRIQEAANQWASGSKFKFIFDSSKQCDTNKNWGACDKLNVIDRGPVTAAGAIASPAAASAVCGESANPGRMQSCDIRLKDNVTLHDGAGAPAADAFDLASVMVHEFGHCLGLGDVDGGADGASVMTADLAVGVSRRKPTTDDIAGRDDIYK